MLRFKTLKQFAETYTMADVTTTEEVFISEDSEHGGLWECRLIVSSFGKSVELYGKQHINAGQYRYMDNGGSGQFLNFSSLWKGN